MVPLPRLSLGGPKLEISPIKMRPVTDPASLEEGIAVATSSAPVSPVASLKLDQVRHFDSYGNSIGSVAGPRIDSADFLKGLEDLRSEEKNKTLKQSAEDIVSFIDSSLHFTEIWNLYSRNSQYSEKIIEMQKPDFSWEDIRNAEWHSCRIDIVKTISGMVSETFRVLGFSPVKGAHFGTERPSSDVDENLIEDSEERLSEYQLILGKIIFDRLWFHYLGGLSSVKADVEVYPRSSSQRYSADLLKTEEGKKKYYYEVIRLVGALKLFTAQKKAEDSLRDDTELERKILDDYGNIMSEYFGKELKQEVLEFEAKIHEGIEDCVKEGEDHSFAAVKNASSMLITLSKKMDKSSREIDSLRKRIFLFPCDKKKHDDLLIEYCRLGVIKNYFLNGGYLGLGTFNAICARRGGQLFLQEKEQMILEEDLKDLNIRLEIARKHLNETVSKPEQEISVEEVAKLQKEQEFLIAENLRLTKLKSRIQDKRPSDPEKERKSHQKSLYAMPTGYQKNNHLDLFESFMENSLCFIRKMQQMLEEGHDIGPSFIKGMKYANRALKHAQELADAGILKFDKSDAAEKSFVEKADRTSKQAQPFRHGHRRVISDALSVDSETSDDVGDVDLSDVGVGIVDGDADEPQREETRTPTHRRLSALSDQASLKTDQSRRGSVASGAASAVALALPELPVMSIVQEEGGDDKDIEEILGHIEKIFALSKREISFERRRDFVAARFVNVLQGRKTLTQQQSEW